MDIDTKTNDLMEFIKTSQEQQVSGDRIISIFEHAYSAIFEYVKASPFSTRWKYRVAFKRGQETEMALVYAKMMEFKYLTPLDIEIVYPDPRTLDAPYIVLTFSNPAISE